MVMARFGEDTVMRPAEMGLVTAVDGCKVPAVQSQSLSPLVSLAVRTKLRATPPPPKNQPQIKSSSEQIISELFLLGS